MDPFCRVAVQPPARLQSACYLVSSAAFGEGNLIAETVLLENRPARHAIRASKLLAVVDWAGVDYHPVVKTPEEAMHAIESTPASLVVYDDFPGPEYLTHNALLARMVRHIRTGGDCSLRLPGRTPPAAASTSTNSTAGPSPGRARSKST